MQAAARHDATLPSPATGDGKLHRLDDRNVTLTAEVAMIGYPMYRRCDGRSACSRDLTPNDFDSIEQTSAIDEHFRLMRPALKRLRKLCVSLRSRSSFHPAASKRRFSRHSETAIHTTVLAVQREILNIAKRSQRSAGCGQRPIANRYFCVVKPCFHR
jgi:hypothetical protein